MQNFIAEFKQVFSREYCEKLINQFEQSQYKKPGKTGSGVDKTKKDSLDLYLSKQADWQEDCQNISQIILQATIEYAKLHPLLLTGSISPSFLDPQTNQLQTIHYNDLAKLPEQQIESIIRTIYRLDDINMQRYTKGKGGYHHWHSEHYPHPTDSSQRSLHRVLLWLIYLNDVEQGGETEFFYQQTKIKPSQGSLILAPCTFTHTHRGHIPISNDKYVLASWILYNPAQQLYSQK